MDRFPDALRRKAERLLEAAGAAGVSVATAESCTGGLVAALLTDIAGSSAVFECGFVTYSNTAKTNMLGVPATLLDSHGAVSEPVARAMAEGALERSTASASVSITGVAGPGGGSDEKPVGLVHFACAVRAETTVAVVHRFGDIGRSEVRTASVEVALDLLLQAVQTLSGVPAP